jgi:hypothetical protein
MDTLYLVFKDRFQLSWIALQTTKTLLKQTKTLTEAPCSVKRRQGSKFVIFSNKKAAFLQAILKRKAALKRAIQNF